MATIESYETKAGKRYRVRYRTPGRGQTDKRGFRTKRDAEAFAATVEVAKIRGEYVAAVARPRDAWVSWPRLARSQAARHSAVALPDARVGLAGTCCNRTGVAVGVADVDQLGVEAWIAGMVRKGAAPRRCCGRTVCCRGSSPTR